jgi:3-dehydroquinate synthase
MSRILLTHLDERSYPIYIGKNSLDEIDKHLIENAVLVTDENVWSLYKEKIEDLVCRDSVIIVPAGEKSKSLKELDILYKKLVRLKFRRNSPLIAFGGGVVGDLTGFAAATFMRGVPFVQIPTTLLAQVDSSVGGKVAINLDEGKNLVGSFYQPKMVISDTNFLKTLTTRDILSGLGEVIKYAFIGNQRVFELLSQNENLFDCIDELVYECCLTKSKIVEEDEFDQKNRMILNFGHTFAHAIEKEFNYEKYNHGEAVAIGMFLAIKTGIELGFTSPEALNKIILIFQKNRVNYMPDFDLNKIIRHMTNDKKNTNNEITLILIKDIGTPFIHKLNSETLIKILRNGGA